MKTILLSISTLFIAILSYGQTLSTGQLDFGTQNMSLLTTVNTSTNIVTITVTGPVATWFGIGFNGTSMHNTYTLIFKENDGAIEERVLINRTKGNLLSTQDISVSSDTNDGTIRTVILTRPRLGTDAASYDFPTVDGTTTNIIWGVGPNNGIYESDFSMGSHNIGGIQISFDTTLSLKDVSNSLANTMVYPNPSNGSVSFENAKNVSVIQVFNMLGEKLKEIDYRSQNSNTIELSDLNPGMYSLLLIGEENQKAVKRVILQ